MTGTLPTEGWVSGFNDPFGRDHLLLHSFLDGIGWKDFFTGANGHRYVLLNSSGNSHCSCIAVPNLLNILTPSIDPFRFLGSY